MNTILFDLDGTLLPIDMKLFEKIYFEELGKIFIDISPEEIVPLIWSCTKAMVQNIEFRTNRDVFMEVLGNKVRNLDLYQQKFDTFYKTTFDKVGEYIKDLPVIRDCVKILRDKGYKIVLATNPLFPQVALYKRIRWAGFEPDDFAYISTFENNHYCKPQLKFYEEVLRDIKRTPKECIMVGNDVQEDLAARRLGIQTYLITDFLLNRNGEEIVTDYLGTYKEFYNFVTKLPNIK